LRRKCAIRFWVAVCAPTKRRQDRGFGLAIVRDLAELYGGSIALTAAPGGGLRANLNLPS
jgi:signal transduction histidine kinase